MKHIIGLCCLTFTLATFAMAQNPNTAVFPAGVAQDSDLLVQKNNAYTTLAAPINSSTTAVVLTNAANFPTPVAITIDAEILKCTSHMGTTYICSRGFAGTTAAAHRSQADVRGNVIDWHLNQTNAEVKAIEQKLHTETVSIRDKGAVGDGSADDTAAIQAAINAVAAAGGGTVYCPPGNYRTTAEILITRSGIIFEGAANKSSVGGITFGLGCHIIGTSTTADVIHVKTLGTGENGIYIRDISIEGNVSGGSTGNCIHIDPAFAGSTLSNGAIERVAVDHCKGDGILLDGATSGAGDTNRSVFAWKLSDITAIANGRWGVETINAGELTLGRVYADSNAGGQTRYFRSQTVVGTQMTESDTPAGTNAVEITASSDVRLYSNHLESNAGQFFLIQGSQGTQIFGVNGTQTSTYGMQVKTYTDPILGLTRTRGLWVDGPTWACGSGCTNRVDVSDDSAEKSGLYFWTHADGAFAPSDFHGYEANFPANGIFLMGGWITQTDGTSPGTTARGKFIFDPTRYAFGFGTKPFPGYTVSVTGPMTSRHAAADGSQNFFSDYFGGSRGAVIVQNDADASAGRGTGFGMNSGRGILKGLVDIEATDGTQNGYSTCLWSYPAGGPMTRAICGKDNSGALQIVTYGNPLVLNNSNARIFSGSGSPNGAVTASPGAIYLNTDGDAGATLYVKETGTNSNTGWVAK